MNVTEISTVSFSDDLKMLKLTVYEHLVLKQKILYIVIREETQEKEKDSDIFCIRIVNLIPKFLSSAEFGLWEGINIFG